MLLENWVFSFDKATSLGERLWIQTSLTPLEKTFSNILSMVEYKSIKILCF